jgi:peroxiredoxin
VAQETEPAKPVQPAQSAQEPAQEATETVQTVEKRAVEAAAFQEQEAEAEIPPVLLTDQHAALSRVKVGDTLPAIELPQASGGNAKLPSMYGKAATVVVFWKSDRGMAIQELSDLGPDVVEKFGSQGVAVVGVAAGEPAAGARAAIQKTSADFPQLLDADGAAFAKVGSEKLPWTLVLDPGGKIVWFDLEYSPATRRELQQVLLALTR